LEATFAVIVWGASFVATKVALRTVSPVSVIWLRFGMGLLVLFASVVWRKQFAPVTRKELGFLAFLGFLGVTFHQWLQSVGLQTAQATTTSWIVATTPIFMAILGWLLLREQLKALQMLGIALAAVGVLAIVSGGEIGALISGDFGTIGDFLILISAVNWAIFSVLSRRILLRLPASLVVFYVMAFGWLFTSLLLVIGPGLSEVPALDGAGWAAIIFLGVFCSGLAYIGWYDALQVLPVAQSGAFIYIEPLVTVVVAGIILGESFNLASVLGGGAILLGVWMVNRRA
jgi:drug/metabolite transporter (DMT)-like permease